MANRKTAAYRSAAAAIARSAAANKAAWARRPYTFKRLAAYRGA